MVRKGNEAWKIADVYPSSFETDLQELIISDPSILPITNIREGASELVLAIKEVSIRGKSIDVLGFTRDGDIAIIECKLAKNEEARRKVIGQILEYAAYLWRLNYDELDDIIKNNYGKSLIELIQENSSESLDEETFIKNVGNNLKSGSFMLLIATDRINETLEKIIKFINEASQSNFSLHAIELKRFKSGDIEILLPYIHGLTEKPTESVKTARYWDEESFFSELKSNANKIEYNLSILEDQYMKFKLVFEDEGVLGKQYMHNPYSAYLTKPIISTTVDTLSLLMFGLFLEDLSHIINRVWSGTFKGSLGHYLYLWSSYTLSNII